MVVPNKSALRYAITNLSASLSTATRAQQWLEDLRRWCASDLDFVQLREKTLAASEVLQLAETAMTLLQEPLCGDENHPPRTKLLVNGRPDIAAAARAHGVHLTSRPGELTPAQVRHVFQAAGLTRGTVSLSCHTLDEVARARDGGADLILFGPIFEKRLGPAHTLQGIGLDRLHTAAARASPTPVLALGGVTAATAKACLDAGAQGVAGIRLFASEREPPQRAKIRL